MRVPEWLRSLRKRPVAMVLWTGVGVSLALAIWFASWRVVLERHNTRVQGAWNAWREVCGPGPTNRDTSLQRFAAFTPGIPSGELFGYRDASGDEVIPARFLLAAPQFCDGLSWVKDDSGLVGYIDRRGEYVIQPTYYAAADFCDGMGSVTRIDDRGWPLRGYVSADGRLVVPPRFHSVENFRGSYTMVGEEVEFSKSISHALRGYEGTPWHGVKRFHLLNRDGKVVEPSELLHMAKQRAAHR